MNLIVYINGKLLIRFCKKNKKNNVWTKESGIKEHGVLCPKWFLLTGHHYSDFVFFKIHQFMIIIIF